MNGRVQYKGLWLVSTNPTEWGTEDRAMVLSMDEFQTFADNFERPDELTFRKYRHSRQSVESHVCGVLNDTASCMVHWDRDWSDIRDRSYMDGGVSPHSALVNHRQQRRVR